MPNIIYLHRLITGALTFFGLLDRDKTIQINSELFIIIQLPQKLNENYVFRIFVDCKFLHFRIRAEKFRIYEKFRYFKYIHNISLLIHAINIYKILGIDTVIAFHMTCDLK